MVQRRPDRLHMEVFEVDVGPPDAGWHPVLMRTDRGDLELRHHPAPGARAGVVLVGGVGGGWDSPAQGLYERLGADLGPAGVCALRVRYRVPAVFDECVLDLRAGCQYLLELGTDALGLVGHSFGGAVVIRVAEALQGKARTVVTLATQSWGTDRVAHLPGECSLLCVHGVQDDVLPPACSEQVYERAHDPRRLVLLSRAGHVLDEAADEVHGLVRDWLVKELAPARAAAARARA
ncbi:MAG: alpha/beta hydrolase [Planctomycetes bacterium]|nr:alpha/beta hydrolase [Planctomycetota bacterium]